MQIQPSSQFTIFRQIGDHTDSNRNNYYIVATIRNTATAQLYETLLLESKGNGEYSKKWNVIPNSSPDGTWITIKTSVYTDAGLTTLSNKYSEMADTYLVKEYTQHYAGGIDIDYDKIKELVEKNGSKSIKIPEVDFGPINEAINTIKNDIKDVDYTKIPDPTLLEMKLDIVTSWLETLNESLEKLEAKKYPEVINYNNVMNGINNINDRLDILEKEIEIFKDEKEKDTQAKQEISVNIAEEINKLINL